MFVSGYDQKIFYQICKKSGEPQTLKDINFMRAITHWQPGYVVFAERCGEISCIFGYYIPDKKVMRIVGMATDKDHQGKGIGKALLRRAMAKAKKNGMETATTRTFHGVNFYAQKGGFKIVGEKGQDFIMEAKL